jgi:acyl-CoA synthetase (NDP forming)|tara:strand:- start:2529 stop:4586 length:2058 start_codon:yes stop_codon:yes gene_type:complete
MNKGNLRRLISPKSIAVVGNRGANFAIKESIKLGFKKQIWAIHPSLDSLEGIKCFRDIKDLPEAPDATFIAVNAETAIDIVSDLKSMGGGGAVLYASGFGEVGEEGFQRNQRLLKAADGMPLIGPNCYGFINSLDGIALWPDVHGCEPVAKGVAIITQSGNIGLNMTMQSSGLQIAYMFTLGNQTNTNIADIIHAMLDDSRVNAIGLHIEGISDVESFDVAARRAQKMKVPIIAIKSGKTKASAKIALSHTSSLTGSDELYSVFFERLGVARVDTVPEFLETLKLISVLGVIKHNGVASMSCSGGEAGMMADLIDGMEITFPSLTKSHKARVKQTLNEYVEVDNPLDYHTFIWGDRKRTSECFKAMISDRFAATMLLLDWPKTQESEQKDWDSTLLALSDAISGTSEKAIVLASMDDCMPKRIIEECLNLGIAPMIGLDICLKALNHSYKIGQAFASKPMPEIKILNTHRENKINKQLTEFEGKQLLMEYGIPIPKGFLVKNLTEALKAAEDITYPVTLKVSVTKLSHKTELGGVRLNIQNSIMLEEACNDLFKISSVLLIEKMIEGSVCELIIGIDHDPTFGKHIIIGAGGIFVELLKDSSVLILPVSREDIQQALSKLKVYQLLQGYRDDLKGDIEAVIDAVMSVIELIKVNDVEELDINPLLVLKEKNGVVAADTLIRLNSN